MLRYLARKSKFWHFLHQEPERRDVTSSQELLLKSNLQQNLNVLRHILGDSNDVIVREFEMGSKKNIRSKRTINACVIFLDGLVDKALVNRNILEPLMYDSRFDITSMTSIRKKLISVGEVKEIIYINDVIEDCLSGDTCLLVDGFKHALVISSRGWDNRGVQEPPTQAVVRGPREGFTETLRTNTSLLRRKIHNPNLTFESLTLGKRTKTTVSIAYIKGIIRPDLVKEIKDRLNRIHIDAVLESGYIEEYIEDFPFSPFPTVGNSEKPDVVAANLLEGRAAILVDGTPFVLTAPFLFVEGFQSPEDYYERSYYTSLIRLLRFLAFLVSILAPAVYVALTTFHQDLLPTPLIITMISAREGTPFPSILEVIGMGIMYEILREAGVRLPRNVGQAVSIVGTLVIGEAAVSAGLIGAPVVILVAVTAICSYVVAPYTNAGIILRLTLTIFSGLMGALGITLGMIGLLIHLTSLRSFGTAFFSPLAPLGPKDMKDVFIRVPWWAMITRPKLGWRETKRQALNQRPEPPVEE